MTNRTHSWRRNAVLAILSASFMGGMSMHTAGQELKLYVAANGSDTWSGRRPEPNGAGTDGPFATVPAAQAAIRKLERPLTQPVTVYIRAGTHRLTAPLVFTPGDAGSAKCPVTYAAYPDEVPVLSGGKPITGFRQNGRLWETTVPEVKAGQWFFRQLFVDGKRRPRARMPNKGYFHMAGSAPPARDADGNLVDRGKSAFTFEPGDVKQWERLEDVNIILMHSWETSIHSIKSVDTDANVVEFTAPLKEWWKIGHWEPQGRYYVENVREGLDQPGEWYLNRTTGVLSYVPMPGEEIGTTQVVAPVLTEFMRLEGSAVLGVFVEHVHFRGLAFHHADWVLSPQGNSSTQAAVDVPAAITADGALNCSIEQCDIAHIGTYAVWFRRGCRDCRVCRNHLHDLGAGGVRIGDSHMAANDVDETRRTLVDNNYIHDHGEVYAAGIGVWLAHSSDNRISHNEIHDSYYSGISLGWNWSDCETRTLRNTVEFNHIHHVGRGALSDMGGIYTLGRQTGTVLRNNLIHDVFPYAQPAMAWGIYHDAYSNGITDENNICYNTMSGGIMNTGTFGNIIRNNIFAHCARQIVWRWKWEREPATAFERNICCVVQGELFNNDGGRTDVQSKWDYNLFWRADGKPLRFYDMTFEQWQEKGMGRHSIVADPQFVDPENCDFQLKPSSPAITKLGFKPIDTSQCGLYGDSEWVAMPRKVTFTPTVLPPAVPPPPPPRPIDEDFETTPEGAAPRDVRLYGVELETSGSICVSTELARSGSRSLKITDSPTLEHIWDPHLYYTPHFYEGRARFRFSIYVKPGALPACEWRDGRQPFRVGPSLRIDGAGQLSANAKALMPVPHDQWFDVEIVCGLGQAATGTWQLTVTTPGQEPAVFEQLPCGDPEFDCLVWLGFTSLAREKTEYYLDRLKLEAE